MLLKDKVCIVTGAGKGFGEDIAKEFYAQGAKLALITRSQIDVNDLIV
jgi:NADP-dependent 3-hydroxy acid dehydrogenase YdfG